MTRPNIALAAALAAHYATYHGLTRISHTHSRNNRATRYAPSPTTKPPAGRNDACPCGSGRKFKKCCMNKPATEAL